MTKFRIVGSNLKTSARMVIEVEAQNRAAAERAAAAAGMEVLHVEQVPEDPLEGVLHHAERRASHRGEDARPSRRGLWVVILLVVIVLLLVVFWWLRR